MLKSIYLHFGLNNVQFVIYLAEIWVYPIKSLGGIALPDARVEMRGLEHDRRWMLVDESGRFMSQREFPMMTQLSCSLTATHLEVFHKKMPHQRLRIPFDWPESALIPMQVSIWDDTLEALAYPETFNTWFSVHLGAPLTLVKIPDAARRITDPRYAPEGQHVSLSDGFPYLLISEASLAALNERLELPLPMNRFRPNLVVRGALPHAEDEWSDFRIGAVPFRGVKPCARCVVTTTDQENGMRSAEPLRTLATYRKQGNKILFGQNVIWTGHAPASISVGDLLVFD